MDGTNQTSAVTGVEASPITAIDATGTGAGWKLQIVATDFISGPNSGLDIIMSDGDTVVGSGSAATGPLSSVASLTPIPEAPAAALTFASAALNTGLGTYTLKP